MTPIPYTPDLLDADGNLPPGIYAGVPFSVYAGLAGHSWSSIKEIGKSPRRYRWRRDNPRPDTAGLGVLRGVHARILEPDVYATEFAVYDGRRDKRAKAYQAFLDEHDGATILNPKEAAEIEEAAAAVLAYPPAAALLGHPNAHTEVTMVWDDPATGLRCKGRADLLVIADGRASLIDLKTVRRIGPRFARDAADLGYHGQLAHYAAGLLAVMPSLSEVRTGLLAVEGSDERDVGLYMLTDADEYAGRQYRDGLLSTLAGCLERDEWPGQQPEWTTLGLPAWAPGFPDFDNDDII